MKNSHEAALSKVPEVTLLFWVIKIAATTLGETGGDAVSILLDLGLPKRDGLEVLRRLRRDGIRIPVLVITAMDTIEDRIQGLDLGADVIKNVRGAGWLVERPR